jgi:hypothetical protein
MDTTAATEVAQFALTVAAALIVPIATWLARRAVRALEARTGIDVPAAQEQKIDDWIEEAIHYAEEKSWQKIKAKTEKLSGPEKLEEAADFVLAFAEARKWDEWTRETLKSKIEAKLGLARANGAKPSLDRDADDAGDGE